MSIGYECSVPLIACSRPPGRPLAAPSPPQGPAFSTGPFKVYHCRLSRVTIQNWAFWSKGAERLAGRALFGERTSNEPLPTASSEGTLTR
jgi:hypothetical protein